MVKKPVYRKETRITRCGQSVYEHSQKYEFHFVGIVPFLHIHDCCVFSDGSCTSNCGQTAEDERPCLSALRGRPV